MTTAPSQATEQRQRVVILGAGVGGLAAGYFLARTGRFDVTVLDQASLVGGLCASFEHKGFVLDHGAHKLHSVIPGILDEIRALMGDRLVKLEKRNRISLGGGLLDYPLRLLNVARVLGIGELVRLGFGYAAAFAGGFLPRPPERSYEQYIVRRFGRPVYERVFAPLAEKVWGDPATLHPDMARTRIPATGGLDVILRLLKLKTESEEKNARYFYYPRAGFGDWPEALREQIVERGGRVLVNTRVDALERTKDGVDAVLATVGGRAERFPCDYLVSSVPLPVLAGLIFGQSDLALQEAVTGLQFRHLVLVYLFVHRPLILKDQWIFFPEEEFLFSRIFEQKQMNPALGPPNETAICCDFTCTEESWHWAATDKELALRCAEGLVRGGFIDPGEATDFLVKRQRNFYPRYDLAYAQKMQIVSDRLRTVGNVLTTGRIGMYNYNNSDHCADMGRFIADGLARGEAPPDIWQALEQRVKGYRIVD